MQRLCSLFLLLIHSAPWSRVRLKLNCQILLSENCWWPLIAPAPHLVLLRYCRVVFPADLKPRGYKWRVFLKNFQLAPLLCSCRAMEICLNQITFVYKDFACHFVGWWLHIYYGIEIYQALLWYHFFHDTSHSSQKNLISYRSCHFTNFNLSFEKHSIFVNIGVFFLWTIPNW